VAAHAIPRKLYAIEDIRHAHAARRPNIRGSHRQNPKLQQEIFFSWSTIKITLIALLYVPKHLVDIVPPVQIPGRVHSLRVGPTN
jgi:hypothetical protein